MLIKLAEWLDRTDHLRRPHVAIVKDNNDPKKLGRVKVHCEGLFTEKDSPWVTPKNNTFLGGSSNSHLLVVPEIGSQLLIEFPYDDFYSPEYTGKYNTTPTRSPELEADYPNTYGFKDSAGNYFRINKTSGDTEFHHSSNTIIKIDASGNVTLTNPGDATLIIGGDMSANVSGKTTLNSGTEIEFNAPSIKMN